MPPRPAGSSIVTAKSTRTPFTANDDKILLEWVAAKAENNRDAGNKMFQQLGEKVRRAYNKFHEDIYAILSIHIIHGKPGVIVMLKNIEVNCMSPSSLHSQFM